MKKVRNYRMLRPVAGFTAALCLLLWAAPPAAARDLHRQRQEARKNLRTHTGKLQTLDPEQRRELARRERAAAEKQPDILELSASEMAAIRGKGPYRSAHFSGVLPWQRSLRDVNLCNGNLFKSFTDIQVSPARGAGLAWQRTYNSNDARTGPFGTGWTHAYDIRIEEAGNNQVPRTDFFGGKHTYQRDADGLYSPPPYLFDELSSEYDHFLANGPAEVLSDTQTGKDGSVKHFFRNGEERACDWIEDRHGNRTTLTYGLQVTINGVTRGLLTRVTDPAGRHLEISWQNLGTQQSPAWRIVQVRGPFDNLNSPVYTVSYEYNGELNLWKVHQDPAGLNRTTTFGYTSVTGPNGTETGLLASVSDALGRQTDYAYGIAAETGTVWVTDITEPGPAGNRHNWRLRLTLPQFQGDVYVVDAFSSRDSALGSLNPAFRINVHGSLRVTTVNTFYAALGQVGTTYEYDSQFNLTRVGRYQGYPGVTTIEEHMTYGPHGNQLTHRFEGFSNSTTTHTYYHASKYFAKESVTDPLGNVTRFDYFDRNDPYPGNRGQVKWVRDARYGSTGKQFEYAYNQYGQKEREKNLNDVWTEYFYGDQWGNLTQVVQDPGMGGLNRTTRMQYDAAGRVVSSTDPLNQTSRFSYNGAGQPVTASLPGETVSYTYGANGRTERVTGGRGTTTIAYEADRDAVASVADPVTGTISYQYDVLGLRRFTTLPGGGQIEYQYGFDWAGGADDCNKFTPRLVKVIDDQGRDVEYFYNADGRLAEARSNKSYVGGGLVQYQKAEHVLDSDSTGGLSRGWTAQVKNTWHWRDQAGNWQSRVLVQNDYSYSLNGNRVTNTLSESGGPVRTEQYGYDGLSRLTSVNYGDGDSQSYTFDPMGNRLTKVHNGVSEGYTYNAANMLLTRGASSYTNDANGNTLTGGGRANTWDGQNRLVQCVYGSTTTTHTYGADGLRRRTVAGANTTDFVLDGQNAVRTLLNGVVDKTIGIKLSSHW